MIVFYFISCYPFDNVCPILLFKPYDMMPYSHLPSHVYLFCTLTHGCTCPPILLLLKYFTPYYFNNFTLSILPLFTLQIYTIIFVYQEKIVLPYCLCVISHTQSATYRQKSILFCFICFYPLPSVIRPLSDRFPFYNRITAP